MANTLFIGITSWNSAKLLDCCITALNRTTDRNNTEVVVLDNFSTDETVEIATRHGVRIVIDQLTQAQALNHLLTLSKAEYTLLIHADTIMLSEHWFDRCVEELINDTILVSPEDIGCGPLTRDFGRGHPESSFLFFNTAAAKKMRRWRVSKQRFKIPTQLELSLDFCGPHITHHLDQLIQRNGKQWKPMRVLPSLSLTDAIYCPVHLSDHWTDEMAYLEYGLGNFYALGDTVTHYHNWFDRIGVHGGMKDALTTGKNNQGFPVQFVHEYTSRFVNDFWNNSINVPEIDLSHQR